MRLDLYMEIKYQEGAGETTRKEEMKASGEERMKRGGQTDKRNMCRGRMDRRWNKRRWMKIQYRSDAAIPTASAPLSPPSEKVTNQPMELRGVEIA